VSHSNDPEIEAMTKVSEALTPLDTETRGRVLNWVLQKFSTQKNIQSSVSPTSLLTTRTPQASSDSHDELSEIIEYNEEDGFIFNFRDVKARSQSDAVNRLLHIAIYAHEKFTGIKEIPRKVLTEVLEEWRANDGNARSFINLHPGFKRKGTGTSAVFFLDRPGKIEAEAFIEDIRNPEISGKWSPSKKSAKKKDNKRNSEDSDL
jgi:hypothetical protein